MKYQYGKVTIGMPVFMDDKTAVGIQERNTELQKNRD